MNYIYFRQNEWRDFWHNFQIREKASLRVPVEPILTYQGWFLVASPWLIFQLWKWRPSPSIILCQTFRPVKLTSSGIRASTLDTGSVVIFIGCQFRLFLLIVRVHFVIATLFVFRLYSVRFDLFSPFSFCLLFIAFVFVLYYVCACQIVSAYSNSVWVKID